VSLSSGDEVPHIFTRRSRLQPGEFLITSAKRLLQQYRPKADKPPVVHFVIILHELVPKPVRVAVLVNQSASRFAVNSVAKKFMPVRLPPGRARLPTRPSLTGSSLTPKTIWISVVAALAAWAA
jgi:hypothetical protein